MATVHVFTSLVFSLQFQTSFMELRAVVERRSHGAADHNHTSEQSWTSKTGIGLPGHYRDQHPPEESDSALLMERHDHSTQIVDIDHVYYASKIYGPGEAAGKELWRSIDETEKGDWKVLNFLSNTHRQAERVNLSFSFPFYGHPLNEITVATGGFIYTGDIIHRMLTATQYIAPLMANFDPSSSKNSTVSYCDNGTAMVVRWNHIHLQDNIRQGAFTFQASLHSDGRIIFTYKEIPVDISSISSENHPVKVGLADAFVVLHKIEQIPSIRRRTVYEYHRVEILKSKIFTSTVIEILPLPTCLQFSRCGPCVTSQIGFNCSWCSRLQRCSSGFDRNRQDWVDLGCPEERREQQCLPVTNITNSTASHMTHTTPPVTTASKPHSATPSHVSRTSTITNPSSHGSASRKNKSNVQQPTDGISYHINKAPLIEESGEDVDRGQPIGLLAGIVMVMVVTAAAIVTSIYMYKHPTSRFSLFFMERRPAHWPILKFRRGSGRPSYAEVEAPGQDRDGSVVIDLKQSFSMPDRRESEQKEGFIVPDQRECFLRSESS